MLSHDLQATHQILKLLESSKSGVDVILDNMPGIFAVVTVDGVILRANSYVAKIFGTDHEGLLGRRLEELFAPEIWADFQARLAGAPAAGEFEFEFEALVKGNRSYVLQVNHFRALGKQVTGLFSVIGKDISDFKAALTQACSLSKDLEVTRAVQELLLPVSDRFTNRHFELASYYKPAAQSGGDWWWFSEQEDGSVFAIVGDVTGHGVGSAMVTAAIASCYHSVASVMRGQDERKSIPKMFEILSSTLKTLSRGEYWATLSAIKLNPAENRAIWWNAAGPSLVVKRSGAETKTHSGSSSPLGSDVLSISALELEFLPGDRIFLFTDGAYDRLHPVSGKKVNLRFLCDLFSSSASLPTLEARDHIAAEISALQSNGIEDDMTFVLVSREDR